MNKLLISLLSLTGVAGITTGGYFLLRNGSENVEDSKQATDVQGSGGQAALADGDEAKSGSTGDVVPGAGGVTGADDSGSKPAEFASPQQGAKQ